MIMDSLMGMFSLDMGIDLGTCNTLVCVKGQGIVLKSPDAAQCRLLSIDNSGALVLTAVACP